MELAFSGKTESSAFSSEVFFFEIIVGQIQFQ